MMRRRVSVVVASGRPCCGWCGTLQKQCLGCVFWYLFMTGSPLSLGMARLSTLLVCLL